jgi:hypothetical protein
VLLHLVAEFAAFGLAQRGFFGASRVTLGVRFFPPLRRPPPDVDSLLLELGALRRGEFEVEHQFPGVDVLVHHVPGQRRVAGHQHLVLRPSRSDPAEHHDQCEEAERVTSPHGMPFRVEADR